MYMTPRGWSRELLDACSDGPPRTTTVNRAHELQAALLDLELDWSLSQSRFYNGGQLVFLGAGSNYDIDQLSGYEKESSYEFC